MIIGFVGLGQMGMAMARNLIRAGHTLHVHNRSPQRVIELEKLGAVRFETPGEAAKAAEIVVTMLSDDKATCDVVFGEDTSRGIADSLSENAIHLACSTISPALAVRLSNLHLGRKQHYVSAPVFGRPTAAAEKKLWFVAAGSSQALDRCEPIFDATSQGVYRVGEEPSLANSYKIAGNFLIAAMLESLGEAFSLIHRAGGQQGKFLEVVNAALFKSPLYENYGTMMTNPQSNSAGFPLHLALKDIKLVLDAASQLGVDMPSAEIIQRQMLSGISSGMENSDWSVLGKIISGASKR